MPLAKAVPVPGSAMVTVRELTMTEVRDYVAAQFAAGYRDPFMALGFDGFGYDDLAAQCDATAVQLMAIAPSDLAPVVTACKEINPHFFRLRDAVAAVSLELAEKTRSMPSTEPPPTWWQRAIAMFGLTPSRSG